MMLIGLVPLVLLRWRMNLMSLGDAEARTLGVETRVLRPVLIAGATLITAAAVAMTGVIGWIGGTLPLGMVVALTALELLVAFLQAYVFTILTCIYLNDAIHPGH